MESLDLDGALKVSTETVDHVGETSLASEDLAECHPQYIKFEITRSIVERITDSSGAAFGLHSRHLLFPQVYQIVEQYFRKKIIFRHEANKLTASYQVIADLTPMPTPSATTGSVATFTPIPSFAISASHSTEVSISGSTATTTARQERKVMKQSRITAP